VTGSRADGQYVGFIDWLKCLGMLLIMYGHLAGWAPLAALPPIYSKQLGVAFFLFVTGYSLNRETRNRWHVAFNRLFEVYVFGLALAVIMSGVTYATHRQLQISNYAPFIGGVNVLFNFFPANPTTWYLGTYLHVILLWALFAHRIRVSVPLLVLSFVVEIAIRALLMQTAGGFVAYMTLPNWWTTFLLGCWYGQRRDGESQTVSQASAVAAGVTLAVSVIAWSAIAARVPFERTFPFMHLGGFGATSGSLLVSAMVSVVYLSTTWLVFTTVRPIPTPGPVRFVARNTLVIFLAHMPLLFALQPILVAWGASRFTMSAILMLVCGPGLAWLSEIIHRGGRIREWRDRAFRSLQAISLGR
jgi:hypothetical protein